MGCVIEDMTHDYFCQQYYKAGARINDKSYRFLGFILEGTSPENATSELPSKSQSYTHICNQAIAMPEFAKVPETVKQKVLELSLKGLREEKARAIDYASQCANALVTFTKQKALTDLQNAQSRAGYKDAYDLALLVTTFYAAILEKYSQTGTKAKAPLSKIMLVFQNLDNTTEYHLEPYEAFSRLDYFDVLRGYVPLTNRYLDTLNKARALNCANYGINMTETKLLKLCMEPVYMELERACKHMLENGIREWPINPHTLVQMDNNRTFHIQHRSIGTIGSVSRKEIKLPRKLEATINIALLREVLNG